MAEAAVEQAADSAWRIAGAIRTGGESCGGSGAKLPPPQVWRRIRYRPSSPLLQAGRGAHNVTVSGSAAPLAHYCSPPDGGETLRTVQLCGGQRFQKRPTPLNLLCVSGGQPAAQTDGGQRSVRQHRTGWCGKRHISGLVTAARVVGHEGKCLLA